MKRADSKGTGTGKKRGGAKRATTNGAADPTRFQLGEVLDGERHARLQELYEFWEGGRNGAAPESEEELRQCLRTWMVDPDLVEDRIRNLGRRLGAVVEHLVTAPGFRRGWGELESARSLSYMSSYDLEACVAALVRRGFVLVGDDSRFEHYGDRMVGLPVELGESLARHRREKVRGIFGNVTLRGHLDLVYSDPAAGSRMTPHRLRELYKMYSQETASTARIERLPDGVRGLVEKAILEFGGILPRQLFERMDTRLPHWNGRRWRMILEQSLIGTVRELDLSNYGIQLQDETLIVFSEVTLAWLRRVAVPGDPDRPHEELSLGVDLASNISRFLAYIDEHGVRFTVRGEIFKTTEKKILQHLIPNPGRELSREEVLKFIFRFAKRTGLIDRTGKRTFMVTSAGREWSAQPILAKTRALLDFSLEERPPDGGLFHQAPLREIFQRLLKRVEPGTWYDLMYLPFLARNTYLASLDERHVAEEFADRSQNGRFPAMEDPQRLAWNLVKWVRQRLYLLGLVDLGYDGAQRPVAMRLTQAAAKIFGLDPVGPVAPGGVGSLIVTPDFEVVLFPTGDDAELIHDLDRFCTREKRGQVLHFRVTQDGIRRALRDGMGLDDIQRVLERHSRTPVPQNVVFSIRDWALAGGLLRLSEDLVLTSGEPEVLRRFQQDAGARKYVMEVLDETSLQLKGRVTAKRLRSLLRELGYLVELGGPVR